MEAWSGLRAVEYGSSEMSERESPRPGARAFVVVGDDRDPGVFCDRALESLGTGSPFVFTVIEQQDDLARRSAAAFPVTMSMKVSGVSALARFRLIRGWIDDRWVTFSVSRHPIEFDLYEGAPRLSK